MRRGGPQPINALILNGALKGDDELDAVHGTLVTELVERGHAVRSFVLRDTAITFCRGCFECWTRSPGLCRTKDLGRDVAGSFINADVVFFLTPVTFGGYSSELKKALDRLIGLVLPFFTRIKGETHHKARYAAYPRLVVLGMMPAPSEEEELVFHTLALRNALNMHVPWYACRVLYRSRSAADGALVLQRALLELEAVA